MFARSSLISALKIPCKPTVDYASQKGVDPLTQILAYYYHNVNFLSAESKWGCRSRFLPKINLISVLISGSRQKKLHSLADRKHVCSKDVMGGGSPARAPRAYSGFLFLSFKDFQFWKLLYFVILLLLQINNS